MSEENESDIRLKEKILGGILGLAVGDALGVPVEFQSRESLRRNPVTDMRGYGTLCLLDSLAKKEFDWRAKNSLHPDYIDTMQRFLSWSG